jgi:hypothetical protein
MRVDTAWVAFLAVRRRRFDWRIELLIEWLACCIGRAEQRAEWVD